MRRTLAPLLVVIAAAALFVSVAGSPAGAGAGCAESLTIVIDIDANGGDYENSVPAVPTVFLELADSGSPNHDIEFSILPQTWGVALATIEWVDGEGATHEVSNSTGAPVVTGTFSVDQSEDFQSWGAIATFDVVNCGGGQTTTTTTEGSTTSTTGGAVSPTTATQAPDTLPRTGSSNVTLSLLAAGALLTGTAFVITARRIRESR